MHSLIDELKKENKEYREKIILLESTLNLISEVVKEHYNEEEFMRYAEKKLSNARRKLEHKV